MDEGEVEMGGIPQRAAPDIATPDIITFDDAAALAAMREVEMGTPQGQAAHVRGTGTQPWVNETPMDYAYSNGKGDYKYAYIKEKLHMIKK